MMTRGRESLTLFCIHDNENMRIEFSSPNTPTGYKIEAPHPFQKYVFVSPATLKDGGPGAFLDLFPHH